MALRSSIVNLLLRYTPDPRVTTSSTVNTAYLGMEFGEQKVIVSQHQVGLGIEKKKNVKRKEKRGGIKGKQNRGKRKIRERKFVRRSMNSNVWSKIWNMNREDLTR